jgi:hypothetical protein
MKNIVYVASRLLYKIRKIAVVAGQRLRKLAFYNDGLEYRTASLKRDTANKKQGHTEVSYTLYSTKIDPIFTC